ncbi:MAG: insulinase family protein [Caldilineaceae bacterium]|nr:insulinase family protein [Caldilineaceae bacterium]
MALAKLTKTTLKNGMQVILRESHVAPVASFWVFFRVGSRNELPGRTGVSHWVEHMLFKGTEQFPPGELDKAVARAGGLFNGMTSQDWTTYYETLPADRIELALQIESDRLANSLFDPDETESERTVILAEREGSENSYFYLLQEEIQAVAHPAHSYHHPIIGWKSDLLTMTRDDLYNHYRAFYTPNNAVAVLVGDFDTASMLQKLEAYFGSLPATRPSLHPRVQNPPQRAERRVILRGPDLTAYLILAFPAPEAIHDDFFPLIVMDAVLGGAKGMGLFGGGVNNRSNRLYKALVDTELAVGVQSSYQPTIDADLFSFAVTLAPGVTHNQIEAAIWAELAKIQQTGVTQAELEKAIKQTKAQFAYSTESVTHQAYWLGVSEVLASTEWLDTWLERLTAVSAVDVQRVAQSYFRPERQNIGWYMPAEPTVETESS